MESKKTISGSSIVDAISQLNINSIPELWYKNIRQKKSPHAMAILILWDLLYWYKWTEVRDEETGLIIGYKKKFKADLLQRSYTAIAKKFGISKTNAADIIYFLEQLGVLKREFRTITVGDTKMSNVLFIALNPVRIKEISEITVDDFSTEEEKKSTPMESEQHTYEEKTPEVSGKFLQTNTITSQSNSQSNSQTNSQSFSHCEQSCESSESTQSNSLSDKDSNSKSHCGKATEDKEFKNHVQEIKLLYLTNYHSLVEKNMVSEKPAVVWSRATNKIKECVKNFGFDTVKKVLTASLNDNWIIKNGYVLTTILSDTVFSRLAQSVNQTNRQQSFNKPSYQKPQKQWTDDHLIL